MVAMKICPQCGEQNPADADFCSCGRYLGYDEAVEVGPGPGAATGRAAGAASTGVDPARDVTEPIDPVPASAGPPPGSDIPAVEPEELRVAPSAPDVVRRADRPDDRICERCGIRNDASRTLCVCGHELGTEVLTIDPPDAGADAARLPWWRRIRDVRRSARRATTTGKVGDARAKLFRARRARGRVRGLTRRAQSFRAGAALAGGGLLGVALIPSLRGPALDSAGFAVRSDNHRYVSLDAATVPVGSVIEGWEPWMIGDNSLNRAWGVELPAGVPVAADLPALDGDAGCDDGAATMLTLTFADPDDDGVDVDRVAIWNGTWADDDSRELRPRPARVQFRFDDEARTCRVVDLDDHTDRQTVGVKARNVRSVDIVVLAVHPGQGESRRTAISEMWWEVRK